MSFQFMQHQKPKLEVVENQSLKLISRSYVRTHMDNSEYTYTFDEVLALIDSSDKNTSDFDITDEGFTCYVINLYNALQQESKRIVYKSTRGYSIDDTIDRSVYTANVLAYMLSNTNCSINDYKLIDDIVKGADHEIIVPNGKYVSITKHLVHLSSFLNGKSTKEDTISRLNDTYIDEHKIEEFFLANITKDQLKTLVDSGFTRILFKDCKMIFMKSRYKKYPWLIPYINYAAAHQYKYNFYSYKHISKIKAWYEKFIAKYESKKVKG